MLVRWLGKRTGPIRPRSRSTAACGADLGWGEPFVSVNTLHFAFAGGTNLDPEKDEHIHSATIVFVDGDHVETSWVGYQGGEEAGTMTLALARASGDK